MATMGVHESMSKRLTHNVFMKLPEVQNGELDGVPPPVDADYSRVQSVCTLREEGVLQADRKAVSRRVREETVGRQFHTTLVEKLQPVVNEVNLA